MRSHSKPGVLSKVLRLTKLNAPTPITALLPGLLIVVARVVNKNTKPKVLIAISNQKLFISTLGINAR